MKHIHKKPKGKYSFFRKVLIYLLAVTLTLTLLLTTVLTMIFFKTTISLTNKYNSNILEQTNYSITYVDEIVERIAMTLFNDNHVITFFNMDERDNMVPILSSKVLDNLLLTSANVSSIYLYNANLDLFYSSKSGEQSSSDIFADQKIAELVTDKDFVSNRTRSPIPTNINPVNQSSDTFSYFIFENNKSSSGLQNALIVNIDSSTLTDSIESMNNFSTGIDMSYLVIDQDGIILSSANSDDIIASDDWHSLKSTTKHKHQNYQNYYPVINGTKYLLSLTNTNLYSWNIVNLVPFNIVFKDIISTSLLVAVLVAFIFLLVATICLRLAKRLNSPVQEMMGLLTVTPSTTSISNKMDIEEFEFIHTVFQSMRTENKKLDKFKKETKHSLKHDFLNSLVSGNNIHSLEQTHSKLEALNLTYLIHNKLLMCVLKIDEYVKFKTGNNQKERWALRFAVVNIASEISENYFPCEIFSQDADKFVMIIDYDLVKNTEEFQSKHTQMLTEIQDNVKNHIEISLSVAYDTAFQGLGHLPFAYNRLKDLLQLKVKYGHGCIITPLMADEIPTDESELPFKQVGLLIENILDAKSDTALKVYGSISKDIFEFNYTVINSSITHLVYSIYTAVVANTSYLKDDLTIMIKDFFIELQDAEISTDINSLMENLIVELCKKIDSVKARLAESNYKIIVDKIYEIIDREYSDHSLCLNSIADQLNLSTNYTGHIFKSYTNQSVAQYISDYRMTKIEYFMNNTSLPLASILDKVGIENNNYFYTRFKKHFGVSLTEYRLNLQNQDKEIN